jgi:hypothetical protein
VRPRAARYRRSRAGHVARRTPSTGSFEHRGEGAFLAYLRQILLNNVRDSVRRAAARPRATTLDEKLEDPAPSRSNKRSGPSWSSVSSALWRASSRSRARRHPANRIPLLASTDRRRSGQAVCQCRTHGGGTRAGDVVAGDA